MLISFTHQFLFVHIPKNAGVSVDVALGPYANTPETLWMNRLLTSVGINVNYLAPPEGKMFRRHVSARQIQNQLPRQAYNELFKFAFVRNPWDRLVSLYHYILKTPFHHRHRRVRAMQNFEEYLAYELRRNKSHQKPMLTDQNGKLIVDFVGRFETLHSDFAHVCRTLGIHAKLPHVNGSVHSDYRSYYDDRTLELVGAHFRDDIEMFGYTFDERPRRVA